MTMAAVAPTMLALLLLAILASINSWIESSPAIFDFEPRRQHGQNHNDDRRRRLSESSASGHKHEHDIEHVLNLATRPAEDTFTEDEAPLRVLFIVTTLAEYDKGTRGTTTGADRLKENLLPLLVDGVSSMVDRGWDVDVYLICGFEELKESRRQLIHDALPPNVGLEVYSVILVEKRVNLLVCYFSCSLFFVKASTLLIL